MVTRIRRVGLTVSLGLLLLATALAGVAWAANIQCPNDPQGNTGTCWGTQGADVIIGTSQKDFIDAQRGADLVRAGSGADHIAGDDYWRGEDLLVDEKSGKNPDVFRCGAGRDEVTYNKGLDRVGDDCEVLSPVSKSSIYPE